jgi:hypothetical protein
MKQSMNKDIQFAYAAGILDAEGCFSICRQSKYNSVGPRVQVVMTDLKPLRRLQGLFGGSLVETKMASNGRKVPYHFTASGKNARRLIESTLPLLIEKREQAKLLLELQDNIDEWNRKPRLRGNLPVEVMEYRMSLKQRVHELKDLSVSVAPKERTQAKREKLAYLAGILEGEGCFTIIRGEGNSFASVVSIMMCHRSILDEVVSMFGGTIIERKQANGRTILMWRVKGQAAADLCRSIAPYVAFRHEELELLRNLQNTTNLWAKRGGRDGIPAHVTAKRVAWKQRIHEIHRPAHAETKSEQPPCGVSDSPICAELSGTGPEMAAVA